MKTVDELKARAKELGQQAAGYSRQATQLLPTNRKGSKELMKKAYESSKECQVVISEILRLENQV